MLKNIILFFLFLFFPLCMRGEESIRIVSLSPAITETISHLGGEKSLVGRSSACDYPQSVKKIPIAGDFAKPYTEKILSLRPHYLLTNDLINPSIIKKFHSLGIKCVMKQSNCAEDYFYWVEFIGKILKKEKEAASEITRVKNILDLLKKKVLSRKKKTVLWLVWDSPIMAAGKNSFPESMIQYAGGINLAGKIRSDYFKCSPEWIVKNQPQVIIFPGLQEKKKKMLSTRYPWNTLSAWKNGNILTHIEEDLLLRPGPRFTDGVLLLHKFLYPCEEQ